MARAKATYDLVANDKTKAAFSSIKKNLGGLKGAFGGLALGVGAAGLVRFTKKVLDAGDEIQKLAIQTGASTEFLSEMRGVLELSGVSYSAFIKTMQRGSKTVLDAQLGLKSAKDGLDLLGLSVDELVGLKPEEQFLVLGRAIAGVEDPTLRSALQMQLLGARSTEMLRLFRLAPEELANLRAEQVKFGNSLSRDMVDKMADANDSMTRFTQQLQGIGTQFAAEFATPISEGAKVLADVLIPVIRFAGKLFKALGTIIGGVGAALVAFFSGDFSEAFTISQLALKDFATSLSELIGLQEAAGVAPGPGITAASATAKQAAQAAGGKTENKDPQIAETNRLLREQNQKISSIVAVAG